MSGPQWVWGCGWGHKEPECAGLGEGMPEDVVITIIHPLCPGLCDEPLGFIPFHPQQSKEVRCKEGRAQTNHPLGHVYAASRIMSENWNSDARAHRGKLRHWASDTSWFWLPSEQLVIVPVVEGRILGCHSGEIYCNHSKTCRLIPKGKHNQENGVWPKKQGFYGEKHWEKYLEVGERKAKCSH